MCVWGGGGGGGWGGGGVMKGEVDELRCTQDRLADYDLKGRLKNLNFQNMFLQLQMILHFQISSPDGEKNLTPRFRNIEIGVNVHGV